MGKSALRDMYGRDYEEAKEQREAAAKLNEIASER